MTHEILTKKGLSVSDLVKELQEDYGFDDRKMDIVNYNIELLLDETIGFFSIKNNDYKQVATAYNFVSAGYMNVLCDYYMRQTTTYLKQGAEVEDINYDIVYLTRQDAKEAIPDMFKPLVKVDDFKTFFEYFKGEKAERTTDKA
jgi:hypothetical protein